MGPIRNWKPPITHADENDSRFTLCGRVKREVRDTMGPWGWFSYVTCLACMRTTTYREAREAHEQA